MPAPEQAPALLQECLLRQFDLAWRLAAYHLDGLDMATCLWRQAARGLHVTPVAGGGWTGDWRQGGGRRWWRCPLTNGIWRRAATGRFRHGPLPMW